MKYLKKFNESIDSDFINWKLINDAKDMALEYIDDGVNLNLWVDLHSNGSRSSKNQMGREIYNLFYNHNKTEENKIYLKFIQIDPRNPDAKITIPEDHYLSYGISLDDRGFSPHTEETRELVDRLKKTYPNEIIYHNFSD